MEQFTKLTAKLSELFELEKSDLDFGIHRIIKARQDKIRTFLSSDTDTNEPTLRKIVLREIGEANTAELEASLHDVSEKLKDEFGKRAFDGETLTDIEALGSPEGKLWQQLSDQLGADTNGANEQLEAEIYSQLTTFFSRYYDDADFISKRRIKAGASPYAVPYSGEEVMLHWANKDQYYIKSSKDLKDYTFTLPERFGKLRVQFKCMRQDPVLNNNNAKREFHLDDEAPIEVCSDALVIPFHFKIVPKTRTKVAKSAFTQEILDAIPLDTEGPSELVTVSKQAHQIWIKALTYNPEGAVNNLLTRHLNNYTRKNESDFFIHKNLNQFLNQELDFYIKNEVMHLDDIDERSTDYLTAEVRKIKAIRTIAKHIITFLSQLENFQKKIWLKKKYVTETNYCFTLDHIFGYAPELIKTVLESINQPIRRYDGLQRSQQDEWIKLYGINEFEDYPADCNLTEDFLKAHDKLMLDTVFYDLDFKYQLLAAIPDIDGALDGLVIHSDNFQALNLLQERFRNKIRCVYLDPPYNTAVSAIPYKNNYKHSSWAGLLQDRLLLLRNMMSDNSACYVSIDKNERNTLEGTLNYAFGEDNKVEELIWCQNTNDGRAKTFSTNHEYVEVYAKKLSVVEDDLAMFREPKPGYKEVIELIQSLNPEYPLLEDVEPSLRTLYRDNRNAYKAQVEADGLNWNVEKRNDPWNGIYQYKFCEYRDADGRFVEEQDAKAKRAKIWVFRESDWTIMESDQKQSSTTKDPDHSNYRYYRPIHPVTNKPCAMPSRGWKGTQFIDPVYPKRNSWESLMNDHRIAVGGDEKKVPQQKRFLHEVDSNVAKSIIVDYADGEKETSNLFGKKGVFLAPKHTSFVGRFIRQATSKNDWVMDFFGGSGSTAGAVIESNRLDSLNRHYVTVETNDYIDSVILPRLKKQVFSAKWKDGNPTSSDTGITHAFKYLRLESYEDALNNLNLGEDRSADLLGLDDSVREDYLFSYMLDVESRGHLLNLERFRDPWGCQLKIHDPHTGKSEPKAIDLIETFNYLIGITVHELKLKDGFLRIEGENPQGETILIIWRKLEGESDWPETTNADLQTYVENTPGLNPADTEYAAIYVNGDHTLDDPHSKISVIEDAFYDRMFAHTGNPDD